MEQPSRRTSSSSTGESWKIANDGMDSADRKQQTKRALEEDEEHKRPAKGLKRATSNEVYEELRERKAVPYPHPLVANISSRSIDNNLEDMDRHLNSLREMVRVNDIKDAAGSQDKPSDDDSSSGDGTRGDEEEYIISEEKVNQRSGTPIPQRAPSPQFHSLTSPASSISPISLKVESHTLPISTLQSVLASCLSSNWPSTSSPPFLTLYRWWKRKQERGEKRKERRGEKRKERRKRWKHVAYWRRKQKTWKGLT